MIARIALIIILLCPFLSHAQNVGIGTSTPEMPLHVEGDQGTGLRITRTNGPVHFDLKANVAEASLGTTTNHSLRFITSNSTRMDINSLGNITIGTINGPQKLNVSGGIKISNTNIGAQGSMRYANGMFEGYTTSGWTPLSSVSPWEDTDPDGIHYNGGNVGIGTTPNSTDKLYVSGQINGGGSAMVRTLSSGLIGSTQYRAGKLELLSKTTPFLQSTTTKTAIEIVAMGQLPGVGIISDTRPEINLYNTSEEQAISLDFLAGLGTVVSESLLIKDAGSTEEFLEVTPNYNNSALMQFYDDGNARLKLMGSESTVSKGSAIKMYNRNNELTIELDGDYNENGRITTSEIEIKGGADFAEHFDIVPTGAEALPGMVVCIDAENEGKLVLSANAYDKKVAGIVSGANGVRPGMMMGHEGTIADGKYPIALTGRVYAMASMEAGRIEPGDLLTTSSKVGHVMKVNDISKAHGAIVGKAMTSLQKEGEFVLVLINLQ